MNILVIGAGVIGVTTACELKRQGHEVTVIERRDQAAGGASHANGCFLSAAHSNPWGEAGLPTMAIRSFFQSDSPIGFKLNFSASQISWLWGMLRQCSTKQYVRNRDRMVPLSRYSRQRLDDIEQYTGVRQYGRRDAGSLVLFRDPAKVEGASHHAQALHDMGFDAQWLSPDEVRELEPGLKEAKGPLAGGLLVRDDSSGDCQVFTSDLMRWNQEQGVRFVQSQAITRVEVAGGRVQAVCAGDQRFTADAYVFATGSETGRLLNKLFRVPVYPVKGYSFTAPLANLDVAPRRAVLDDGSKLAIARFDDHIRVAGVAEVSDDLTIQRRRTKQIMDIYSQWYPRAADLTQAKFWTGLRPMTPDGTPIIGTTPIANLYLNTGQGTYGWTMAAGSASLLADIVSGRKPALNPANYALTRRN
ncbi:MAG: D-amino acid dehydrogenase [Propionibacteriaceae bacterium]|nr:D-amino acid dehydrogenase [Propionibacteriaceae bacterium]